MRTINRTPEKKYDAILCADLHLREDVPTCRTDDYLKAQWHKLSFIRGLCILHSCPLLCAGDLLDHWKPSPWLLSQCLEYLPPLTITVAGQHDTVGHNLQELSKTGLNVLQRANRVLILYNGLERRIGHFTTIYGYSYGEKAKKTLKTKENERKLLLWHVLACEEKQPWPDAKALQIKGGGMMGYDTIVTGDNHQQFQYSNWTNPGSMMRMTANQINHEPAVYGWREEDNAITRIPLPIVTGVVSREHLGKEKREDRDVRMQAYITRAKAQFEIGLSFEENLKTHIKKQKVSKEVEKEIWEACK